MKTLIFTTLAALVVGLGPALGQEEQGDCTAETMEMLSSEAQLAVDSLSLTDSERAEFLAGQMEQQEALFVAAGSDDGACAFYRAVIDAASS